MLIVQPEDCTVLSQLSSAFVELSFAMLLSLLQGKSLAPV
jgi:hypothetical protein